MIKDILSNHPLHSIRFSNGEVFHFTGRNASRLSNDEYNDGLFTLILPNGTLRRFDESETISYIKTGPYETKSGKEASIIPEL
jgi:hypothetical protein